MGLRGLEDLPGLGGGLVAHPVEAADVRILGRPVLPRRESFRYSDSSSAAEGASRPSSTYVSLGGPDSGGLGGGERKTHKTAAHYRAEAAAEASGVAAPAGPAGVVLGDMPFPSGMEVVLDPGLGLGSGIIIPADLRQAPPSVQLDPEHTTHVPAQRYQEICQRFGFALSYIGRLYSDVYERDLEIGRLRRHQSRQSSAVSRLQAEVERLRTRLEVEGIPLDSFEEDEDGSSSDDAPPSPPHPVAAGPSRRRR
ncbi:hypothetical protein JCGZ_18231 [Jatropha curcas]|uniref:Uncharacterized protein n=1 Tax=Jatropha curcas TaxID=180498 RepID=A0A067KD08_JATCU|nr:hypothetical protein JCGZ_18231 [Jatropha curcas]